MSVQTPGPDPQPTLEGGGRPPTADPARLDLAARRAAGALLLVIVAVVAVIVFWPGPPDPSGQSALEAFLRRQHERGLPDWISFGLIQNLANVVMFLPLGYLGALAMRRHNYLVVAAAALGSGLIELVQLLLLPHRVASWPDIASNTVGALVGLLLAVPVLRRRRKRRRQFLRGHRGAVDSDRRAARIARI
ncbi:VanZ family protein [Nakamurella panacisegetis]|nr:VanZ family protein [Nakamurella panacisegetis]